MVKNTGSDKKVATATEVKPGSRKTGNDPIAGQAKANFTSKKEQPKTGITGSKLNIKQ